MKRYRRLTCMLLLIFAVFLCLPCAVLADENEAEIDVPVPEILLDYLPAETGDFSPAEVLKTFDFGFFTKIGIRMIADSAPDAARSFALLLGLMLMAAVLGIFRRTVTAQGLQTVMELASMVCIASAVFAVTETAFALSESYISSLSSFMRRITPTMSAFMIASGQMTSAAVITGVIFTAVTLLETIVASVLFPMIRLSLCLSVVTTLFGVTGISGIAPMVKKMISYVFGFVALCLSAVLMFQGIIAKSADSLALRGIKFAVGQFVPFVGGAVNEALATLIGGVGKIKAATGVVGAVIVCLLAAMPVIRILLHKLFMELVSVCAGILGLSSESRLMSEVASFLGYMAATTAISSVFFVLSLSIMASLG